MIIIIIIFFLFFLFFFHLIVTTPLPHLPLQKRTRSARGAVRLQGESGGTEALPGAAAHRHTDVAAASAAVRAYVRACNIKQTGNVLFEIGYILYSADYRELGIMTSK